MPSRAPADPRPARPGGSTLVSGSQVAVCVGRLGLDASGASYQLSCFVSPWVRCPISHARREAQRRTGAVGGRWCPVDWLGSTALPLAVPLSCGDDEVGGSLLSAPSSSANASPVYITPGVRGGLSSRVGCMGRALRLN